MPHRVEDRARKMIEDGRAEGISESEEISQEVKSWAEGIEAAVLEVARAVDSIRQELALGSG